MNLVLVLKTSYWYRFHPFYLSFSPGCDLNARECFDGPAAPQQGMLGALIVWWPASFWLQWTMAEGTVHRVYWQSSKVPNQTHRGMKKIRKMYAIKQIKICAEYRDMLPRPRLDLSGTPGLRPIGLSPGSWQTSLGLGLYSLSGKTSYRKISISLEAARFGFKLFQSLWNLAVTSAALLPRCLPNFRAIRPLQHPISRLRDFTRFGGKKSYRLVNRGPG